MSNAMNNERAAAAEFALKAYSLESDPADFGVEPGVIQEIRKSVDLPKHPKMPYAAWS